MTTLDGRLARSVRTRTAVIDALLALYEEGDLNPTAVRVAGRAGVALRTVYGHFADMESLYAEAGERELARTLERVTTVDPDLPYVERLDLFASGRAAVLEFLLPVMRAMVAKEPGSPQLQHARAQFIGLGDFEVHLAFARELGLLPEERRLRLLDLVHLVAGGPAWATLRVDRALDPEQAAAVLRAGLEAALGSVLD